MKQITVAVVGFGNRAEIYSSYALTHKDEMKIVAVVDPNDVRRNYAKRLFSIPEENCFSEYESFVNRGRIADCVINGTMDKMHIETTLPLLPLGYDILLEKPVTNRKEDFIRLVRESKKYGNKIIVCHVLRYTPFYKSIKQDVLAGKIGKIRHIETTENVGIAHASISYIRGKWNNSDICGSSYLLAKCCHDLDLLCWFNSEGVPKEVSSFGNRSFFIEENAPVGAGSRCLTDCKAEKDCPFSAKKMHLDNNPMPFAVWAGIPKLPDEVSYKEKVESLKTDNPHGRCIFKTDANLVDQQLTMVTFSNGVTAYHSLFSGATRAGRRIKIYGSLGEIEGFTEDNAYALRRYNADNILFTEQTVKITEQIDGDGHYGGDSRIVADFLRVINGEAPSVSTSDLSVSLYSHLCVYAADESMEQKRVVALTDIERE